jgi:thioredoxin reductase
VDLIDSEVLAARRIVRGEEGHVSLAAECGEFTARKLLLATGTRDELPQIENFSRFYGKSVHHCPYCDGWEHRGRVLLALGDGAHAVELALLLRGWSPHVIACTNGQILSIDEQATLAANAIKWHCDVPVKLEGEAVLHAVKLADGSSVDCDAMFFSNSQTQHSHLAIQLGCRCDQKGLIHTQRKQASTVPGLFVAGDADGEVQFAIVAAAEGAIAGVAINTELQRQGTSKHGAPRGLSAQST